VPASIIKNEIIPKMRKQPNYLARARIRILNGRGEEIKPGSIDWNSEKAVNYTLRQDSGVGNSLGLIRIAMPNPDAVYMHDTPSRNLFANDYRFLSHGCVRVQGVYDLAAWLLQGVPVSGSADPSGAAAPVFGRRLDRPDDPAAHRHRRARGHQAAEARAGDLGLHDRLGLGDGTVHFRDDVYNVDTVGG